MNLFFNRKGSFSLLVGSAPLQTLKEVQNAEFRSVVRGVQFAPNHGTVSHPWVEMATEIYRRTHQCLWLCSCGASIFATGQPSVCTFCGSCYMRCWRYRHWRRQSPDRINSKSRSAQPKTVG
jgi:hypothetical protein